MPFLYICVFGGVAYFDMPGFQAGARKSNDYFTFRQHAFHDITPFYSNDCLWVMDEFCQLSGNNSRLGQAVKVEVHKRKFTGVVFAADSEGWAGNMVGTAYALCQAAHECCFAAAQVTDQYNNLTAAQFTAEQARERFGVF